jgi:hypothetical protein
MKSLLLTLSATLLSASAFALEPVTFCSVESAPNTSIELALTDIPGELAVTLVEVSATGAKHVVQTQYLARLRPSRSGPTVPNSVYDLYNSGEEVVGKLVFNRSSRDGHSSIQIDEKDLNGPIACIGAAI